MGYLGYKPADKPLTAADITDSIITSAKIVDGTIVNADINASSAIAISKIAATGTANQVLRMNSGATALEFATVSGTTFGSALLHVRDEKTSGTAGGASVDSYTKRDLNTTLTNEISGASISSSVITLPAGTFYILASAPIFKSNQHKLKLRNTSDSTDTLIGTSEYSDNDYNVNNRSFVTGRFTIASSKNFELQHRVSAVVASNGLGVSSSHGNVEVYADCQIWKVA
jgi:hypothetical protein